MASWKDKAKDLADKAKDAAGKAKDKVDDMVDKNREKIPDKLERTYDKVSDKAEKHLPGEDAPGTAPKVTTISGPAALADTPATDATSTSNDSASSSAAGEYPMPEAGTASRQD